jgi:hypothetical protein
VKKIFLAQWIEIRARKTPNGVQTNDEGKKKIHKITSLQFQILLGVNELVL